MTQRVKPLFEDAAAPHELREFVELARGDGPSQAELQRLASRVEAAVGVAVAMPLLESVQVGSAPEQVLAGSDYLASAFGKSTFASLLSSTSAKLIAAVGLSAGLGLGIWSQARTSAPVAPRASLQAPPVVAPAPVHPPRSLPAPVPVVEALEPSEIVAQETSERVAQKRKAVHAYVPPAPSEPSSPSEIPRAIANQTPSAIPSAPPPSELGLIKQAQALRGDTKRALALLEEHARFYPDGALAQEREVLAVEVLLRAGELAKGRARAERFAREHADSAHLPRLRALIERLGGG